MMSCIWILGFFNLCAGILGSLVNKTIHLLACHFCFIFWCGLDFHIIFLLMCLKMDIICSRKWQCVFSFENELHSITYTAHGISFTVSTFSFSFTTLIAVYHQIMIPSYNYFMLTSIEYWLPLKTFYCFLTVLLFTQFRIFIMIILPIFSIFTKIYNHPVYINVKWRFGASSNSIKFCLTSFLR